MAPKLFHYDCDPGQDDAVALLYALLSSTVNISAVSVVGGNANVENCANNALRILALAKRTDIPVYVGAQRPIRRTLVTLPEVYGLDGLAGGETLPRSPQPAAIQPATEYLEETLDGADVPVSVCATGPLTNLATVLSRRPALAENIAQLVIMGGCPEPEPLRGEMGNFTPPGALGKAEYNFGVDPEAAVIVLASGISDVTLIGLNVTRTALYSGIIDKKLRNSGKTIATVVADILSNVGEDDRSDYKDLTTGPDDPVRSVPGLCHLVGEVSLATTRFPIRVAYNVRVAEFFERFVDVLCRG